jgi:hypothetical protein
MPRFIDLPNQKLRSGKFCPKCGADALHYAYELGALGHYDCASCGEHTATSMHCGHSICENGRYGRCISREMSH